jgi:hypothetical protein
MRAQGPDPAPGEEPLPWDVVIPDDISELDAEVHALHRERRRSRRRAWWSRRLFTRRWNRYGLSGPLVVLVLTGVALVGSLMAVLGPRQPPAPTQRPLARSPQAEPGAVGGLLPAGSVLVAGRERDPRDLRPAVLAFPPPGCACPVTLESLFRQAREYQVGFYLVGAEARSGELRELAAGTGNGSTEVVVDTRNRLAAAYQPRGMTAVLVDRSGVVTAVVRDLGPDVRLEPVLSQLLRPDRST